MSSGCFLQADQDAQAQKEVAAAAMMAQSKMEAENAELTKDLESANREITELQKLLATEKNEKSKLRLDQGARLTAEKKLREADAAQFISLLFVNLCFSCVAFTDRSLNNNLLFYMSRNVPINHLNSAG